MATAKGVLQGYTAVAAVDSKAQIIVAAQAHGSGSEQSVLLPMVQSTEALRTEQTLVTADAGYHSKENLQELYERGVPALIADNLMRRRDERFKDQAKYKQLPDPLWDKTAKPSNGKFTPADFQYDPIVSAAVSASAIRAPTTPKPSRALNAQPTATSRMTKPMISAADLRLFEVICSYRGQVPGTRAG